MAGAKVSRKEQGEQTRQAIVQAAVELYAEAGVQSTGLIAIGERAGVSHATILYHFGSSKGLVLAVLAERDRRFRDVAADLRGGALASLARLPVVAQFHVEHPVWAKAFVVLQVENLDTDDEVHDYFVARRNEMRRLLLELLREARRRGEIRADIAEEAVADEFLAFAAGAQVQHSLDPARVDLVEMYQHYTDRLLADLTSGTSSGS